MNEYLRIGGVAVLSFAAGAAISYYFTRKMMIDKVDEIVEEASHLDEEWEEYNHQDDDIIEIEEEPPAKVFKRYRKVSKDRITKDTEFTPDNFRKFIREGMDMTGMEDEWNYEEELAKRSPEAPYVIHVDEFRDDCLEYSKVSLEYYEIDDVIVDERNTLLPNVDEILGEDNLKRFGDGSGDTEIVYIRNERLESDFEVTKSLKSYAAEIYGYIEHSYKRKVHKFHLDEE